MSEESAIAETLDAWLANCPNVPCRTAVERLARGMASLPDTLLVCSAPGELPARIELQRAGGRPFAMLECNGRGEAAMRFPVRLVTDTFALGEFEELETGDPVLRCELQDPVSQTEGDAPEESEDVTWPQVTALEAMLVEAHDRSENADGD